MKINKITIKKLSPSGGSSFLSLIKSKIPCKSKLLSHKLILKADFKTKQHQLF